MIPTSFLIPNTFHANIFHFPSVIHLFMYWCIILFIQNRSFIEKFIHSFILNQRGTHIGHDLTRDFTLPRRSVGR